MKKGKIKIWKILLSILTILIIPLNKAKALTQSNYINLGQNEITMGNSYRFYPINAQGNRITPFNNLGEVEGTLIFSYYTSANDTNGQYQPFEVVVSGNGLYTCDIGQTQAYIDNTQQIFVTTAKCPVKFNNTYGLQYIDFQRTYTPANPQTIKLGVSYLATFVSKDESNVAVNVNQQEVVNEVEASTDAIKHQIGASMQANIDASNANWQNFEDYDISESAKEQPNQDEYDNVQEKEENVYENLDDINIETLIDMNVDLETNNWIWQTMTRILNTNARVFSMVVGILSLGLCKFILGR